MSDVLARLDAVWNAIMWEEGDWDSGEAFSPEHRVSEPLVRPFVVRKMVALAPMLRRLEDLGAAWSFAQLLKRCYTNMRATLPTLTPLAHLTKGEGKSVRWGGCGAYWEVTT